MIYKDGTELYFLKNNTTENILAARESGHQLPSIRVTKVANLIAPEALKDVEIGTLWRLGPAIKIKEGSSSTVISQPQKIEATFLGSVEKRIDPPIESTTVSQIVPKILELQEESLSETSFDDTESSTEKAKSNDVSDGGILSPTNSSFREVDYLTPFPKDTYQGQAGLRRGSRPESPGGSPIPVDNERLQAWLEDRTLELQRQLQRANNENEELRKENNRVAEERDAPVTQLSELEAIALPDDDSVLGYQVQKYKDSLAREREKHEFKIAEMSRKLAELESQLETLQADTSGVETPKFSFDQNPLLVMSPLTGVASSFERSLSSEHQRSESQHSILETLQNRVTELTTSLNAKVEEVEE